MKGVQNVHRMKPAGNRSSRVASLAILERQVSFQSKDYTYLNSKKEIQGGAKRNTVPLLILGQLLIATPFTNVVILLYTSREWHKHEQERTTYYNN